MFIGLGIACYDDLIDGSLFSFIDPHLKIDGIVFNIDLNRIDLGKQVSVIEI